MAQLPTNMPWELADDKWAAQLNPLLTLPMLQGLQLANVVLKVGANNINHKLGRKMQGWFPTNKNAFADLYCSKPFNDTTLTLNASAPVTVSLWVY